MYIRVPTPHLTDEETESQRDKGPCLQWQRRQWHPGLPAFQCCPLRGQDARAQAVKGDSWACFWPQHSVELSDQGNLGT